MRYFVEARVIILGEVKKIEGSSELTCVPAASDTKQFSHPKFRSKMQSFINTARLLGA